MTTTGAGTGLTPNQTFAAFKFYEGSAEKTKAHAWSQTTWLLALNSGIIAFSVDFYGEHRDIRGFLLIECITASVGIVLCVFLFYLLQQLGGHISHYWTTSNKIAASYPPLKPFIDADDAMASQKPGYRASFPPFCRRLQYLAALFLLAHIVWVCIVAYLVTT